MDAFSRLWPRTVEYAVLAGMLCGMVSGYSCAAKSEIHEVVSDGGIKCRITRWGDCRWRLETADAAGQFHERGAVQALASFMDEARPSPSDDIFDGTRIEIFSKPFAVRVFASDGKMVQEIVSIVRNGDKILVKGTLLEHEAVYGGGERFDNFNKRGTRFQLFIEDGWNRSDTTYIAIPSFTTTRGGGFLVNAYETMTVDFGKTATGIWSVELERETFDAFLFATSRQVYAIARSYELMGSGQAGTEPVAAPGRPTHR